MPQMEVAYLRDWVVLWPATGVDDDGEVTIGSATGTEIRARWNDRRMESLDRKAATIALDAEVVVAQDVPDGSILWLGTLAEWAALGPPGQSDDLHQVRTISRTPDLKERSRRRVLGLMKYRGSLPTVVA